MTLCENIVDMFELSNEESIAGTTILRRRKGKSIDRESRIYFMENDILNVTLVTSDGDNKLRTRVFLSTHLIINANNSNSTMLKF